MLDAADLPGAAVDSPAAQPVVDAAPEPTESAPTTGDDIESRYQAAMAAAEAEGAAESGREQSDGADVPAASSADASATPGDISADPVSVSEAPAEGEAADTSEQPRVKFADLSRNDKAALLAEIRPMVAEIEQENTRLKTEREQIETQQREDARGRYEFFGMDEHGTDAPYLEIVKRAEDGDWDAIQQRAAIEKNRRFGFDAIQRANEGAWTRLESQLQAVRQINGVDADKALQTRDLSKVIQAVADGVASRERTAWATEKAQLEASHKAALAAKDQEMRTKLARAMGEMPTPDSAGSPGAAPAGLASVLRAKPEQQDAWIERAKRGEFSNLPLN